MAKKASAKKTTAKKAAAKRSTSRAGSAPSSLRQIVFVGGMPTVAFSDVEPADEVASQLGLTKPKVDGEASPRSAVRSFAAVTEAVPTPLMHAPSEAALTPAVTARLKSAVADFGAELMQQYPDVVSVGYGLKVSNGKLTNIPTIVCAVIRKEDDESAIADGALLPKSVGGFPVDVVSAPRPRALQVKGGGKGNYTNSATISDKQGTLGGIVFIDGWPCAISNHHVWGGATRAEVYYPVSRRNRIGYVLRVDRQLDAVVALLDGRGFDSYTRFLQTPRGLRAIQRASEPVVGSRVSKTGATTDLTEGVVAQVAGDSYYVVPLAGATGQVSDGGDSGSIVVNSNDEAVGLLWGGDDFSRPGRDDYFAMKSMVRIQESLGFVWTP
jgi:hypothetical protein